MKKIMTLMLGLALVLGTTTAAFGADDTTKSGDHKGKKGKKSSKKGDTTSAPAPAK